MRKKKTLKKKGDTVKHVAKAPALVTRMVKVTCRKCGCLVRLTRKWLAAPGAPTCACGGKMEQE